MAGFNSGPFSVTANGWVGINTAGITDAMLASTFNPTLGTNTNYTQSGVNIIKTLTLTNGVITGYTTGNIQTTSQTQSGVVEMANTTEMRAGTSTTLGICPKTLAESHSDQSYTTSFPSASATSFSIVAGTHKLGTGPFIIQVYDKTGRQVFMDTAYDTTTGEISFGWSTAAASATYTCVVMKM